MNIQLLIFRLCPQYLFYSLLYRPFLLIDIHPSFDFFTLNCFSSDNSIFQGLIEEVRKIKVTGVIMDIDPAAQKYIKLLQTDLRSLLTMRFGEVRTVIVCTYDSSVVCTYDSSEDSIYLRA